MEEGLKNVVLRQDESDGASALERDNGVVGFSRSISVHLCQATLQICFGPYARFVP